MRSLFYWLKKDYGRNIDLVHIISSKINTATGEPQLETINYGITRAVLLPIELYRDFVVKMQSSGYKYGDAYDYAKTVFLIDKRDLPSTYELTFGDYLIYLTRQYKIIKMNDLHNKSVQAIELIVEELPVEQRITLDREPRVSC